MRLGEPHVQGHESRLGSEAKQSEQEGDRPPSAASRCALRIASNVNCQLPPCITPKLRRIAIAPTCAISR